MSAAGAFIRARSERGQAIGGGSSSRIERLSLASQLRAAGAPEEEVEKARLQEALYGPAGAMEVARVLGVEPNEQEPEGIVSKLFDWIQRPGSTVIGAWSGMWGIDRLAADGRPAETGKGFEEALDRALKGLSGAEQYRSNDFGALAYNDDDGGAEKAAKAILGFVVDTALDPLTYVGGPASIFGRKTGASLVDRAVVVAFKKPTKAGDTILSRFADEDKVRIIREIAETGKVTDEQLLYGRMIDFAADRIKDPRQRQRAISRFVNSLSEQRAMSDLAERSIDPAFRLPAMPQDMKMDNVLDAIVRGGYLDDIFMDTVAAEAAQRYVGRQFTGARKILAERLGTSGDELFSLLPKDLQGGLRVRVPLLRKMDNELGIRLPYTFQIPGTGGGRLMEKIRFLNGANEFTHKARNFLRDVPGLRFLNGNLSGKEGELFRRMAIETFGETAPDGAIKYRYYTGKVQANLRSAQRDAEMKEEIGLAAKSLVSLVRNGQKQFGSKFLSEDGGSGALQDMLEQIDLIDDQFVESFAEDSVERVAAMTVSRIKTEMDNMAELIEDVLPDFKRLEADYFPRVWELFMNQYGRTRRGSKGGGLKNLGNQREAWAAVIDTDGKVIRWRTPREIREMTGIDIFKVDPIESILNYMMSVRVILNREFNMMELIKRGLVVYPDIMREVPDMASAVKYAASLRKQLLAGVSRIQKASQELSDIGDDVGVEDYDYLRTIAEQGLLPDGADVADLRKRTRLAAVAPSVTPSISIRGRAKALTDYTAIKLAATIVRMGRRGFDEGYRSMGNRLIFFDGTYIQRVSRGHRIVDSKGRMLMRADSKEQYEKIVKELRAGVDGDNYYIWNPNPMARTGVFFDDEDAASRLLAFLRKGERDKEYIDFSKRVTEMAERTLVESIKEIEEYAGFGARGVRNAFDPDSIPEHKQEEYFAGLTETISRYLGKVKFTKWEISGERYKTSIGDFMAPVGSGTTFDALPGIVDRAKQAKIFAPEGAIESIERMFGGYRNPTEWGKAVEDFYLPFYALQKSLMTVQRGPGYVVRNIIGGMYNAYLIGTTGTHFKLAAGMKIVEVSARKKAIQKAQSEATEYADVQRLATRYFEDFFVEEMTKKYGDDLGGRLVRAFVSWQSNLQRGANTTAMTTGVNAFERVTAGPEIYGDLVVDPLRGVAKVRDMGKVRRVIIWGASENWYAKVMLGMANESEDYLRLAAFLRGTELFGVEDGGFAASMLVKASQFDYSDLSEFEATTVKMLLPFYTWTRNNVPLQFRALASEPGKVNRALRINEQLAGLWGEDESDESPLPSYVRDRFGWTLRPEIYQTAKGDPVSVGLIWGEPLSDINRMFRAPRSGNDYGPNDLVNWREIWNSANPLLKSLSELATMTDTATGGLRPDEEEAPIWAYPLSRRTPDGKRVVSSRTVNFIRDQIPTIGQVERLVPQVFGNDRQERRQVTNWVSTFIGVPVSTLDAFQQAGELRSRQKRLTEQMNRALGESRAERAEFARELILAGVTDEELSILENEIFGGTIAEVPIERLNPTATASTIRFLKNIQMLYALGVPRSELDQMMREFQPPTGGARPFRRTLSVEELASVGYRPEDIVDLSPEDRSELLKKFF